MLLYVNIPYLFQMFVWFAAILSAHDKKHSYVMRATDGNIGLAIQVSPDKTTETLLGAGMTSSSHARSVKRREATIPMEVSASVLQSTSIEGHPTPPSSPSVAPIGTPASPPRLLIPHVPAMDVSTLSDDPEPVFRPLEALESSDFDISHRRDVEDSDEEPQERTLHEDLDDTVIDEEEVRFEVLEKGSKRGGALLVSTDGFTYGVKRKNKETTMWTCSVRSAKMRCHATVLQRGNSFVRGPNAHQHPGDLKLPLLKKVSAEAKEVAVDQVFRPAREIVEATIADTIDNRFLAPKISNVKRYVNNYRAAFRPKDPTDLDFEINMDFLQCQEFLIADVRVGEERHLVFATDHQLEILRQAKRWFIDGTFKIVPSFLKPNGQLMSIHAFVHKDGKSMQFPLLFALMSRRRKEDYIEVFRAVKERLGNSSVEMVTADFEAGAWQAIREVFPTVTLKGCVFHWTKAVWTHVQQLGLVTTFREREGTHNFIKQLLALPFLPWTHIADVFRVMEERAPAALQPLTTYIRTQWIQNPLFPIRSWSVYQFTIRTNNDVEGWHHRMNSKARGLSLSFYQLVPLLSREADVVRTRVAAYLKTCGSIYAAPFQ
ncbi:uncharacterized protein LOC134255924 [Saccostrea cucullata]|uniref:uncharacterized protein LOC134255924 n=1 Tax=Saccostrea cuccullata TaxID=36930 RepID=UPI002ED1F28E